MIVRNAVDHDSRVLRIGRTLARLGFETSILGVVSFTEQRRSSSFDGIPIRRIGPSSRLAWAIYGQVSVLRPSRRGGPGAPRPTVPSARSPARRLPRFATTLAYYARAIRLAARLRPDLVHCNDYNTMWIGVAARMLLGSVVIYDSHELWPDRSMRPEPRWWLLLCEALFVRVADRVTTTSPAYAELMARRYRISEPIVVRNIPKRGPEAPAEPPARTGHEGQTPLAIYVGGLQPNRGLEPAIRALARVDGVRLRLLGPALPDYRSTLEELVAAEGVTERVEFAPPVPPAGVVQALAGADAGLALIQPANLSYRLTLPNKLFEYTLAGIPILGSDMPMIARFVAEHGLGLTVDPDDVDAVAGALGRILEPAQNAAYRAAAVRAARALDGQRELDVLADVYRQAMARRLSRLAP